MTQRPPSAGAPPVADPHRPAEALPDLACDAHCHIYGPFERFPLPPDRSFTPHEAPETALRRLHDRLGIARAVIVQSQGHARDHRPLLDALAVGNGRYRGVALVQPGTDPATLKEYDRAGICGVRFSFMAHLGGKPDLGALRAVVEDVAPLGWHAAIHVAGTGLIEIADMIRSLPVPVVIDHMARPNLADGTAPAVLDALLRLIDSGRVWVKLSGVERLSQGGAPFADVVAYVERILTYAPERILWGTDWPHVNLAGPMPDDGDLVDFILRRTSPAERQRLFVENPARFFGF